jgi:hypothetical protein
MQSDPALVERGSEPILISRRPQADIARMRLLRAGGGTGLAVDRHRVEALPS